MKEGLPLAATTISAKSAMSKAWNLLEEKYPVVLLVLLWHAIRNIVITAVIMYATLSSSIGPAITLGSAVLLFLMSSIEFPYVVLKLIRKEPFNLLRLPKLSILRNGFIVWLLTMPSIWLGVVALVVPGLVLVIFFSTNSFAVADGFGPIQSIKIGWRIARSAFWKIALVFLIFSMLSALSPINLAILEMVLVFTLAFLYNANLANLENVGVRESD
ncbi:MAG: hypothetical protein WCT03_03205 [Candidatus Obscuribacterales bacterium]